MRAIILLATIIIISQTASISSTIDKGLINCLISQEGSIVEASKFCNEPIAANAQCYSNYESLQLCLVNNNCFYNTDDKEVKRCLSRSHWIAGIAGEISLSPQKNSPNSKKR